MRTEGKKGGKISQIAYMLFKWSPFIIVTSHKSFDLKRKNLNKSRKKKIICINWVVILYEYGFFCWWNIFFLLKCWWNRNLNTVSKSLQRHSRSHFWHWVYEFCLHHLIVQAISKADISVEWENWILQLESSLSEKGN